MKLYIQNITIEKNGQTTESLSFSERLSVVSGGVDLYDGIKALLGIREANYRPYHITFTAIVELDAIYQVCGYKEQGKPSFAVTVYNQNTMADCTDAYFQAISEHDELHSALFFDRFRRKDYPKRLMAYRDICQYYPEGNFAALTNGYGTTRSFRGFIADYIKHWKPIRLRKDKAFYLRLSKEGAFLVGDANGDESVRLSASETILYQYLSFLSIADFWSRAEKIRNLNRINKPLIVSNFLEFLDNSIDISDILHRTDKLQRQVIIVAPKELQAEQQLSYYMEKI